MDSPSGTLPFLMFLAVMALGAALFVATAIAFFASAYKRSGPYTANEAARAEARASAFLSSTVPSLFRWESGALADVADRWQGARPCWWTGKIDSEQGTVGSVNQIEGPGYLAFAISRKGIHGFVRLCTSECEMRLEILGRSANVLSRGRPLGVMHGGGLAKMTLMDPSRRVIGSYDRRAFSLIRREYGEVVVRGRALGELKPIVMSGRGVNGPPRPILRNIAPDLTPDEEDWLLAGIASEILHDLVDARLGSD
ncbi:MAG: hypothetical protein JXO72_03290 [Vicinamibacteria bacterium]|nr:hypothetical protein [Vicinamibacteria bacterium]